MKPPAQTPPSDLGKEGLRMWNEATEHLVFDAHELSLLRVACRTADRMEDIADALNGAPLTVTNFKGDEVANPLLVEQRQQAASLAKTLASLRMPTGFTEDGQLIRPASRGAARGARGSYGLRSV